MKRLLALVLAVAVLGMLPGCGAKKAKEEIFSLVEENYDAIVAACRNQDTAALLAIDGITEAKAVDGYVLVFCKGAGIAPSSQDYGFYYTEENRPVAVDGSLYIMCDTDELTPEGNGYQYVDHGNVFYTEQIKGELYFYSTAY